MNEYGTIVGAGTVRFERLLPGPIERVWAWLTDSEKRGRWLASGPMEPRPGGRLELHFAHANLSAEAGEVPEKYRDCADGAGFVVTVTRCEPPRLLAHTWGTGEESEVTFELTPRGEDVLLVLTHRRLQPGEMASVAPGWHTHLDILVDHLNGRAPKPFWATHARLEAEYARRIAA